MIYANYTGIPKRDYLNQYHIDLPQIHSFPEPEYIFEHVVHPNRLCSHNSHVPKNDDHESSFANDYTSRTQSSHFYLSSNRLWSKPNTWEESRHTYEYDRYMLSLLLFPHPYIHISGAVSFLFLIEVCHKLSYDVFSEPILCDTYIPKLYVIGYVSFLSPSCLLRSFETFPNVI